METCMTDNKKNDPAAAHPLSAAPMAYLNSDFLNSPDGRILRILAEYAEPLARFRREKIQDTVVFFGSARFGGMDEPQQKLATPPSPVHSSTTPPPTPRAPHSHDPQTLSPRT